MVRQLILGALAGLGIGGAATYWFVSRRQPVRPNDAAVPGSAAAFMSHPALKYGMPVSDKLRLFSDYVVNFDTTRRNPKWVIEHISKDKLKGDGNRKNSEFFEDPDIEPRFRSKLADYRGSGFDRGHMAPASNHKASQQTMNDTFCLSNMSPQVGKGMNRDYWARFERFVQLLADTCSDVWIITGPLYLPVPTKDGFRMNHALLGAPPQLMSVPTHFYKVVLGEVKPQFGGATKTAVGAFVMPNAPIEADMPLTAFTVPISALEEAAGIRFFPAFLSDERRWALDDASLAWQAVGRSEVRRIKPGSFLPPLLPGEDAGTAAQLQPASKTPAPRAPAGPPMVVTGAAGRGAVHLCEHTECRLPKEEFWKASAGGT